MEKNNAEPVTPLFARAFGFSAIIPYGHTHATMLAENDAPPKYLQKRMGHKTLEVTMRFYLHLTEKMEVKGANVLQTMFGDD